MKNYLSPCGIDCSQCEAYIATQTKDSDLFQKLADQFEASQGFPIDQSALQCDGCRSNGVHISFCSECTIRACAVDSGYDNCAECSEFPCTKGSFIWQEGSVSLSNLEELKLNLQRISNHDCGL